MYHNEQFTFTPSLIDSNTPVLSSIEVSDLENNPFRVITLKNIMNKITSILEDNDIKKDIECWGGCEEKSLIKSPFVGHLRYDRLYYS